MNGSARASKHSSDSMDAHISISVAKTPWWKSSHTVPKSSPPPRLLLVILLLAQVLILAIVRMSPDGLVWASSWDDDLPSSTPHLPNMGLEPPSFSKLSSSSSSSSTIDSDAGTLVLTDQKRMTADASTDKKNIVDSSRTTGHSPVREENAHVERASRENHMKPILNHAAALPTTVDVVKKEHSLIAEKIFGNEGNSEAGESEALHHEDIVETTDEPRGTKHASSRSECNHGYFYVHDLPPLYNRDIIANCTALSVFIDMCDNLLNEGLGPALGEASPLGQDQAWFKSDQFTAEIMFHKRMLEHPCLTDKQEEASAFYVPYYAGLDVGRYLWEGFSAEVRDEVGNHLLQWLVQQPAWKRYNGWGHFLMIGRITWDFRRSKDEDWGSSFFYHPLMQNVTRLLIERNPWDYMEMAVPYPTNFHPHIDEDLVAWQNHIRSKERTNLFSFAGATRPAFWNDFRNILLSQCLEAQNCQFLNCLNRTCENNQRTLELFMNSKFCLQPRGDSFTRRSTFDCLLAGSIPVFFWHRTAYMQYKWHLPEDVERYSVFISKEAMRNGTRIEDVLNAYTPEKVEAMLQVVVELIPKIVYATSGTSLKDHKDAFDVTIEGIMKRFKEELQLSSQW